MKGITHKVISADYIQAILFDGGSVLLVRADSGPHRWCATIELAKEKSEARGEFVPWNVANPGKHDNSNNNVVEMDAGTMERVKATSKKHYDDAEAAQADATKGVAASVAMDEENKRKRIAAGTEAGHTDEDRDYERRREEDRKQREEEQRRDDDLRRDSDRKRQREEDRRREEDRQREEDRRREEDRQREEARRKENEEARRKEEAAAGAFGNTEESG